MGDKVIDLATPIEAHGEQVTQIIIAPPRAKQMRHLPVGVLTMGALLDLAGECASIPPSSMDQLSGADAMKVAEAMGDFLGGGPGETPSA